MSVKKQKIIKINSWTSSIKNSNEKRIKEYIKKILPKYRNIIWDEKKFQYFYTEVLNSLPSRYKQKNSIELSGRLKKEIIEDAIHEKLSEIEEKSKNKPNIQKSEQDSKSESGEAILASYIESTVDEMLENGINVVENSNEYSDPESNATLNIWNDFS